MTNKLGTHGENTIPIYFPFRTFFILYFISQCSRTKRITLEIFGNGLTVVIWWSPVRRCTILLKSNASLTILMSKGNRAYSH